MNKKLGFEFNYEYLFSIVMAVHNTELYLEESILSVINQSLDFTNNTQLIFVDDGSTDNSKDILLKYQDLYPNNILVLSQDNQGPASARNLGLSYVKGKYVNFLDSDDILSENALEKVNEFFNANNDINIVSISKQFFERFFANDKLNHQGYNRVIDLNSESNNPLLSVSSTFIKSAVISFNNCFFNSSLPYSEDLLFLNTLLLYETKIGLVNDAIYYYRQRLSFNGIHDTIIFSDFYYADRFKLVHEHLIDLCINQINHVPDFIQYTLLYDLKCFASNFKLDSSSIDKCKSCLNKIHNILIHIDKKIIDSNDLISTDLKKFFFTLKDKNYESKCEDLILFLNEFSEDEYNNVKVSIIIPVYNVENYLEECLLSVVNQSLEDIEIICINDGSTDNSLEILNDFAQKDSRIRIISKENEGQGIARNLGIKVAIGEYVGFVDSDDYIHKDMFKELYNDAKSKDTDVSMCKVTTFDELNKTKNENDWYFSLKSFEGFNKEVFNHIDTKEFSHEISVTPYNKIYKRSFLIDNDLKFPKDIIFEDEVFFYEIYLKAERISFINRNLYMYRINRVGSTVSRVGDTDFSDMVTVFQHIRNVLKKNDLVDMYKIPIYNKFLHSCLLRYSLSSEKFKPNFWKRMHDDFNDVVNFNQNSYQKIVNSDLINVTDLEPRIKERVIKICSSTNFEEFKVSDSQKIFSIIMAVYNTEKYLDDSISSIINQSIGFVHNIQLILVDDGSTDNSKDILLKYQDSYPDNILVLSQENQGQASARNLGLKYAKGRYINFLDSDDYFSYHALKDVYEFFNVHEDETDVVAMPLIQFGRVNGEHLLNFKFSKTRVIDLSTEPNNPHLHASSSFIKSDALGNIRFPQNFVGSEDGHLMLKVLLKKKSLGVISSSNYFYRKREDFSSTLDTMIDDFKHFTPRLKLHFMEIINYSLKKYGEVPLFLQYSIIYDLQWILSISNKNIFENILTEQEFALYVKNILQFIDDDVILKNSRIQNDIIRKYLLSLKYEKHCEIVDDNIILKINELILDQLKIHKIWLDIVEIKDNFLIISGLFNSLFDRENISIIANKINGNTNECYRGEYIKYYTRPDKEFILDTWQYNSNFDLRIPLSKNEESDIELFVCYHKDGNNYNYDDENLLKFNLTVEFNKFCRFSNTLNYIVSNNFLVLFKDNSFHVSKYSFRKMYKLEQNILQQFKSSNDSKYKNFIRVRRIWLMLYPFFRLLKRFTSIYLFIDRIELAGDNAEHLFNYAIAQKDSIKKFFVLSENSIDYKRLIDKKNIVKFGSRKHKVLYLFADKVISSNPDEEILNPFFNNYSMYSNLFSSKKYFLQHGVTKNNISRWLKKYDRNVSLISTVSKFEQNSLINQENGYDKDIINVLGFPRYDKLNNDDVKKQILIMPTWVNQQFDKNNFKSSLFYIKLNDLFNNEELLDLCSYYGYEIIFRPHPRLIEFLDSFDLPENVKIVLDQSYTQLFNESSLLITDYSSVAFDFAYLKKPIIYYQYYDYINFDINEAHFREDEMGFGDVIKDEDALLRKIRFYLDNGCIMEENYINRVSVFFEYYDNNNCKRNYDWIKKH